MSGIIPATFSPLPAPLDEEAVRREFQRLKDEGASLSMLTETDPAVRNVLAAVFGASSYLTRLVHADPAFALSCFRETPEDLFEALLSEAANAGVRAESETEIMRCLRTVKRRAALLIALADISGFWELEDVTRNLTKLADAAVQAAVTFVLRQGVRQGKLLDANPENSGYVILAMGKMGAHELNYSSDIDLIVFYDAEKAPLADGIEPGPFFVRLTRQVMRILSEITGDGYVFRTDLRLRPDPGSTQVAISVEAAEIYYQTMGQNWERAAMIKARPAAGDIALGRDFLDTIAPWIWRKYLDFAAIADVQSLKRQIHAVKGHGEIAVAGHNLKLGRGGIREIEFFVQTQQLIAGGRNPRLRGRSTLDMLNALADEGWIRREVAEELARAYRFLRIMEHRIQMQMDQQTHLMPTDEEGLERLARFARFAGREDLSRTLRKTLRTVQDHYNALFEDAPELADETGSLVFTGAEDDPETLDTLASMGFMRPKEASRIIRGWHYGRYRAMRSNTARERLTEITPHLLAALARTGDPDAGLVAFDRFLEGLPSGLQLFSLLKANPHLLDLLVTILGTAPELARDLSRRPRLFDAVIAPDFFEPLPDDAAYVRMIEEAVPEAMTYEEALDAARIFTGEQKFRIGVRMITETVTPQEASTAYTALAEAVIARMLRLVRRQLAETHGDFPAARVVVIAMGKLGGREMTATSDLDLILVYDPGADALQSDGRRPLSSGQYFARLTQRLISALSAPTAEGVLYEVDMRLRPSGSQGPVATHLESFRRYHEESAWTWEHLALTRARVITGDDSLRREVEEVICETLTRPRDPEKVKADVLDMRRRIWKEKPPRSEWDLKTARGGMVDVEFITQTLELLAAHDHPEVLDQNTRCALDGLGQAGVLDEARRSELLAAHDLYQHLSHILRLCLQEGFGGEGAPEGFERLVANAASAPGLAEAGALLRERQQKVARIFEELIGGYA